MALNSGEEKDLIDLNVAPSRVPNEKLLGDCIDDVGTKCEEQEHLLDVCPPKLEKKLSLSQQENMLMCENNCDNGDILVTLGHDQGIPLCKRIDVVSSETIKRIRNITKNLEPVIETSNQLSLNLNDKVVVNHTGINEAFNESIFEDNVIRNAFDFLSEHNDEDDEENDNESGNNEGDRKRQELINIIDDDYSEPSTSTGITESARESIRAIQLSKVPTASASSSECSEVDWSWVEEMKSSSVQIPSSGSVGDRNNILFVNELELEQKRMRLVEPERQKDCLNAGSIAMSVTTTTDNKFDNCCNVTNNELLSSSSLSSSSTSTSTTSTSSSLSSSSSTIPGATNIVNNVDECCVSYNATLDTESVVSDNSSYLTASNEVDSTVGNSPASSWMRVSMRRLRHLCLPEIERLSRQTIANELIESTTGPTSLPDIALIAPEILAAHTNGVNSTSTNNRPSSAPVVRNADSISNNRILTFNRGRRNARSRTNTSNTNSSSRDNSIIHCASDNNTSVSIGNSPSRTIGSPQSLDLVSNVTTVTSPTRINERRTNAERENEREENEEEDENSLGKWPHTMNPFLAYISCTLGLFNINRFAILSVEFGANFIIQFLLLSLVLGIPLFTLHVCLGQRLNAGAVDMWRISPVFHGVGIALFIAHAFIGIYSIIGVSWMFVYFRDSFITEQDRYRWAEPYESYRQQDTFKSMNMNISISYKINETVPDYFNAIVLQRHHLNDVEPSVVTLKFQVAFNLAVVWMIVFVSLSKGLRSYGKVIYFFTLFPIFGMLILCTKLLGLTPSGSITELFPVTVWSDFFINNKSWMAASSEVFLTWGLFGAAAMQIAAHNKHKHLLQRDTSLVIVLTLIVLILAAFLANTCVQILQSYGYTYIVSSFEEMSSYIFLHPVNQIITSAHSTTPERFMTHVSFLLGHRVIKPGTSDFNNVKSGYQALRLSTELVPATLAILGTDQVSPFWAVLYYFVIILFGIAQQLAIWHCVITGIMAINTKMTKLWETTITFFSCACAYVFGIPMATELGIYVVYYLDYTIGGAWWIMVLYLVQIGALFAVRGRPHTGEAVVAELFPPNGKYLKFWAGPLLSFTWNVILPVALMVLSIAMFRSSNFRELYSYKKTNKDYWSVWLRQLGAATQLIPILIIPAVAIIQTCRYLNSGPSDFFDRIQLLYRPNMETEETRRHNQSQLRNNTNGNTNHLDNGVLPINSDVLFEDPPPKYTPPPSYTTATGARIAKILRQSFRRSVRRIATVLGENNTLVRSLQLTASSSSSITPPPPPPDYSTVLVEMNQTSLSQNNNINNIIDNNIETSTQSSDIVDSLSTTSDNQFNSINRPMLIDNININNNSNTLDRTKLNNRNRRIQRSGSSNLTASDVANLLRSSIRRGKTNSLHNVPTVTASVENLVNAAAPISNDTSLVSNEHNNHSDNNVEEENKDC